MEEISVNEKSHEKKAFKAKVQKLGSTLSSMVMPNIGALIAWVF